MRITPLHAAHLKAAARMVDFFGWEMPLHYGSQINEHHAVRQTAGIFDISHMGIVDFHGKDALKFLQYLLSKDVGKLNPGMGLYCCLLNPEGGIKDDLIVYRLTENEFRLVINAATREKDLAWFYKQAAAFDVNLEERTDFGMIALQGPKVAPQIPLLFPKTLQTAIADLPAFGMVMHEEWMIARTGYTGEDGFEVILPAVQALDFWDNVLKKTRFAPCGLGARDTLRLEAGLNLYGSDMDETTSPLETGLGWTIDLETERNFIGKIPCLLKRQQGLTQKRVGLIANARTVLRNHQIIYTDAGEGHITSGSFSPTLGVGIALARVPLAANESGEVIVRNKKIPLRIIRPPFVRHGHKCFDGVTL